MRIQRIIVIVVLMALLVPISAQAASHASSLYGRGRSSGCNLPESNAESLEILSNYYPGYWWDHTDLTIAVQAHPKARPAQLNAIHDAIETWSETLNDCFGGLITLTNVTDSALNAQKADIVLRSDSMRSCQVFDLSDYDVHCFNMIDKNHEKTFMPTF